MKTKNFLIILFALFILNVNGQNQFAFYKNGNHLLSSTLNGKISALGVDKKIKRNKTGEVPKYYTYSQMPREVLNSIPISVGMGFYSALQSSNGKGWIFVERTLDQNTYNVCFFDYDKKQKTIIFSQDNAPDINYAFKPIAWSSQEEVVYLEALIFGSATENEGIWSYNIATKQFFKLSISTSYLTTPIISPDGKYFLYGTTTGTKGLESEINGIYILDIQKNRERLIEKSKQNVYSIIGWIDDKITNSDIISIDEYDNSFLKSRSNSAQIQQLTFKLPWQSGTSYCVGRTGNKLPNLNFPPNCSSSTCGSSTGNHGYQAIDFNLPLNTNVLAVAAGTVVFAWFNSTGTQPKTGGYGNLVKIKHSDNTYTYYAHLNTIGVKVGDQVSQGCIIGKVGNTGHSTGAHLHFEWRDVNDALFNSDGFWPVFSEYGCTPNQNKLYTSGNNMQTCTSNFSLNCSSAVTLTCGQSYNGKTEGKQSSLNNQYTGDYSNVSSNPYNSWNDPGPEDVYKIVTTSIGNITATLSNLTSGLDLDVFILSGCNVTNNPGNVTVTSTSSTMINAPAGTYYILVDGAQTMYPPGQSSPPYNGHYGNYTITVNCSGSTCQASTSLSTTNITQTTAKLNWSSVTGALSYSLQKRLAGGTWADVPGGPWTSISMTLSGLTANTNYEWRVRSNCSGGSTSNWSVGSSFKTLQPSCNTPTGLSTTNITQTTAKFNWSSVSGALNYSIQWRIAGGNWADLPGGPWTGTSLSVSGFSANTTYEWRVRSNCSGGSNSNWSTGSTFTTSGSGLANDNCANANSLPVYTYCSYTSATNVSATASTPPPVGPCPSSGYKDVWFKFNMPNISDPLVTIRTTAGSLTDAVMEVYYGNTCSSMSYIICEDDNNDGNGSYMPVISLQGGPNNTIWVRIWGYGGNTGTFNICVFNYYSSNLVGNGNDPTKTTAALGEQFSNREKEIGNDISLKAHEDFSSRINISPNPANDILNVSFIQTEDCHAFSVMLSDLAGKIILNDVFGNRDAREVTKKLGIVDLNPGLYILHINTEKGVLSKKVIIAHN